MRKKTKYNSNPLFKDTITGPLKALVKIGCEVTINAAIPVGIPLR